METTGNPNSLNMPSIEDLEISLRGKRLLSSILDINSPPTTQGKKIADGYVHLVEKTRLEYTSTRDRLIAFYEGGGLFDNYSRAQDHFESCINSLHRAIGYLERLRQMGFHKADGSPFIPRPRDLEVLREHVRTCVKQFRDLSEHRDEDILAGRVPDNEDVAIHLGFDKASLANAEIRYEDVADWIRQLHHFALPLSRVEIIVNIHNESTN